jgi:hypothetical protein
VRVLPEPQHAVARTHIPASWQRVREPVHAGVERGVRQPYVAVDRGEDAGPAARVLGSRTPSVQVVEQVGALNPAWAGER